MQKPFGPPNPLSLSTRTAFSASLLPCGVAGHDNISLRPLGPSKSIADMMAEKESIDAMRARNQGNAGEVG